MRFWRVSDAALIIERAFAADVPQIEWTEMALTRFANQHGYPWITAATIRAWLNELHQLRKVRYIPARYSWKWIG